MVGELDSGPARTSFERSHVLYVIEELGPVCDGGVVRFSPTSKIDGRGIQHIRWVVLTHQASFLG